jgi:hypothetical protein
MKKKAVDVTSTSSWPTDRRVLRGLPPMEYAEAEGEDGEPLPEPATAVVAQVGGDHYTKSSGLCPHCGKEVQHWDVYADQPYLEGAATSYIGRWRDKGGLEDLRKAISFLEKRLRLEELKKRIRLEGRR